MQYRIGQVNLATIGIGVVFWHGEHATGDGFSFNFVGGQHRGAGDLSDGVGGRLGDRLLDQ